MGVPLLWTGGPGLCLGDPAGAPRLGVAVASVGRCVRLESKRRSGAVWCGFGRRDAAGGSVVSLVLLACSQPRIAAQRAVCGRRAARVRPCVRPDALLPARTGRAGALLRGPVVAEPGRRVVCRGRGRSLVSNRVLRVGVAYSLTGCGG